MGDVSQQALRIGIALLAALIAVGGIIWSRLRAHRVDVEGRLEHDYHLIEEQEGFH